MSVVDIFAAMRREAMKAANCQQVRKGPKWGRLKPKAKTAGAKSKLNRSHIRMTTKPFVEC